MYPEWRKTLSPKENITYLFYSVICKIFIFVFRMDKNHAKSKLLVVAAVCHKNKNEFLLNVHFISIHFILVKFFQINIQNTKFIFFSLQMAMNTLNLTKSNVHLVPTLSLLSKKNDKPCVYCNSIKQAFIIHLLTLLDIFAARDHKKLV